MSPIEEAGIETLAEAAGTEPSYRDSVGPSAPSLNGL